MAMQAIPGGGPSETVEIGLARFPCAARRHMTLGAGTYSSGSMREASWRYSLSGRRFCIHIRMYACMYSGGCKLYDPR